MRTTIFSRTPEKTGMISTWTLFSRFMNLLLAGFYLILVYLLSYSPVKHGHGGGFALSQPTYILLFSMIVIVHLLLLFQDHYWAGMGTISGFFLIIISAMTMGLLLFSRQSSSIFQNWYPTQILVYPALILSIGMGIGILSKRNWHISGIQTGDSFIDVSAFPLPSARYRNVRIIAKGGVGAIWYAERTGDHRPVVVKVPQRSDEKTGISFMQEISLWKDLDHENIASVLSANILPSPYIEIEYLPHSLAEMDKPVSVAKALPIIRGLISALIYAHSRGVSHCDIKPTNILLTNEGIPKLTDWGLARSGSSKWSVSGFSPVYAAPEQRKDEPECTFSTDIWQLGLVFSELITGKTTLPTGREPVFMGEAGVLLFSVIHQCLASDPKNRYPSFQALSADFDLLFQRKLEK